jgi:hypothetical protein
MSEFAYEPLHVGIDSSGSETLLCRAYRTLWESRKVRQTHSVSHDKGESGRSLHTHFFLPFFPFRLLRCCGDVLQGR